MGEEEPKTHREWALRERKCTDLVVAQFLMGRMSPQEALDYMRAMEANPATRYPLLPPTE